MPFYHFSYDITPKQEMEQTSIPISKDALSKRFGELLKDKHCTPTVQSTYYCHSWVVNSAEHISNIINGWYESICTPDEKRYYILKLDVCLIYYPNYIYTIDGINQYLQPYPTNSYDEFS